MSETISQLSAAQSPSGTDIFPVTQGASGPNTGNTRAMSLTQFVGWAGPQLGPIAQLTIGHGLQNSSGALAINLASSDVTGALGYTPVNKAGDTVTGAMTFSAAVTMSAGLTLTNLPTTPGTAGSGVLYNDGGALSVS